AQAARTVASQVLRCNGARRARPQPAEPVRLDQRDEFWPVDREERHDERGALAKSGVGLDARVAELQVGGGHVRQTSLFELETPARSVVHGLGGHPLETAL